MFTKLKNFIINYYKLIMKFIIKKSFIENITILIIHFYNSTQLSFYLFHQLRLYYFLLILIMY